VQIPTESYWNEYDNGSEAGDVNEPYTIFVDPEAGSGPPGYNAVSYVFSGLGSAARVPLEKVKGWLSPPSSSGERRPLLQSAPKNDGYFVSNPISPLGTEISETEIDDNDASSSDFPSGYNTHYATFPSIRDQKIVQSREKTLFWATTGSFLAALLLLLVSGTLILTGRHKVRVEVDAAVIVGVFASLMFATLGLCITLHRWARIGWLQRILVAASFLIDCMLSGVLFMLVLGNTSL
jgi:hypothetical protein